MTERIADYAARQAAIDPRGSFIVQAPAGSGKTGLLIQRYLRLLACVDAPEEIIAITFTRKAAGEMRERVVAALRRADDANAPGDAHEAAIWRLARAARARDAALDWRLHSHPARLRIQTIDAFNLSLTRQLPLLSGLGAPPSVADEVSGLYALAARRTLGELGAQSRWSDALATFLLHLDNRFDAAEAMLSGMLSRREQWTAHVLDDPSREELERALATEVALHLERVRSALPGELIGELVALADFAARQLAALERASPIRRCAGLSELPAARAAGLEGWQGLAELLLTGEGQWRKAVNVRIGFPPARADEKARLVALLDRLRDVAGLEHLLHDVRGLPAPHYDEAQWHVLEALKRVLTLAVAELQLAFAERGEVDHAEIARRAMRSLGSDEQPTDLALALDYRIRHVLVDEFQDTSSVQYALLAALTRGWSAGDGRTLFLVGDPMQSIYRFREAEVGLFLRARHEGIGQVALTPLRLSVNFRSRARLIAWVNDGFSALMPTHEDAGAGAVPFEPSRAHHAGDDGGVGIHPLIGEQFDPVAEADRVAALAARRLAETDDGTVAILVSGRPRAAEILPALRRAGLRYQALDVERLATRPVVQDLLALTRALLHEGDRTAWLAVLRAPWCGLGLADLHHIAGDDDRTTIAERLHDAGVHKGLSDDARERLARAWPVLAEVRRQSRRGSLRDRIERLWHAMGGPATAGSAAALEDAQAFLGLLESSERAGDLDDPQTLDETLAVLFARPDPEGDPRLQVMTIHKSKGLEFDTVILPGLHAGPGRDDPAPLAWMERTRLGAEPDLLLVPIHATGQPDHDRLYAFVQRLAREKDFHEQGRLLYVAVTRAIRRLELVGFARTRVTGDGDRTLVTPSSGSLLGRLWPLVAGAFRQALASDSTAPSLPQQGAPAATGRLRLTADWQPPPAQPAVAWHGGIVEFDATPAAEIEFAWVGATARVTGVVVHRFLQQIADDGLGHWDDARIARSRPAIRAMLIGLGIDTQALEQAVARSLQALRATLHDPAGRWVLGAHRDAASELTLVRQGPHGPETRVIDRCFVDADGMRWVIDYKTGYRAGGDPEGFLRQEAERYRGQLSEYAALVQQLDNAPVRMGLYYPLMQAFVEVEREAGR